MRFIADLEIAIDAQDASGSPLATFETFAENVRFDFADYRATENQAASTIMAQLTTYIVIRWRPGVEGTVPGKMRLKHASDLSSSPPVIEYYDIQGAVRDRTMRWAIQLACVRRDSTGFRTGI